MGLLPLARRSSRSHRRYAHEAPDQLSLIQWLRALNTPITEIAQLITGERTLSDLVTNTHDHASSRGTASPPAMRRRATVYLAGVDVAASSSGLPGAPSETPGC
ncbi:hypothetical protein M8I34_08650 [Streptomyces sp. MCA2]|uniref:hypothetical protein n=1 Tax=Streptomyces sp. MCA2 TaxID=2944805 RepID=UPI00202267A7|nr:hypothetical protein [Streptomyces sp. MCA2]MCL7491517.1 hypothetical protein [Streptomyces sp. MCA2]